MSTSGPPITVAALLEQIDAGWVDFERALQEASTKTHPPGEWSALDHMAHIAAWEHSLLQLLRGEPRLSDLPAGATNYEEVGEDAVNEMIYEKYHEMPAKEIRRYAEETHRQLLVTFGGFSDDDLQRPYSHYQPGDPPYNANPVIGWITGNTIEHYTEHGEILRRLGSSS